MSNVSLNASDYFIAEYDLEGNLIKIISNGINPHVFYNNNISGFFKDDTSDAFYIGRNLGYFLNASGYINFGHVIEQTDGIDATISRVDPNDGITLFLNENISVDDNILLKNDVSIYPNPLEEKIYMDFNRTHTKLTIDVFEITGKLIHTVDYENVNHLEIPISLQSGMYFVKINYNDGKSIIRKIIKK